MSSTAAGPAEEGIWGKWMYETFREHRVVTAVAGENADAFTHAHAVELEEGAK